jgi:mRNA interferase YafQ
MKKRNMKIDLLKEVVEQLANDIELDLKYKDHNLTGDYKGFRECHLSPEWLLVYYKDADSLILTLTRTGSHSDLFR